MKEKEGGSSATDHHWSAATSSLDTEICCTSNQSCLTDCLTANLVTGKMTLPFFYAHQNTAKYFSILVLFALNADFFLSLVRSSKYMISIYIHYKPKSHREMQHPSG